MTALGAFEMVGSSLLISNLIEGDGLPVFPIDAQTIVISPPQGGFASLCLTCLSHSELVIVPVVCSLAHCFSRLRERLNSLALGVQPVGEGIGKCHCGGFDTVALALPRPLRCPLPRPEPRKEPV